MRGAALAAACVALPNFVQAEIEFTNLGSIIGGADGAGSTGVSADGGVVSVNGGNTSGNDQAGRRTTGGVASLPNLSSDPFSEAWGVSSDGSTIVGLAGQADNTWIAVKWTGASAPTALSTTAGDSYSEAWAVSSNGSVIVGNSSVDGYMNFNAVKWTAGVATKLTTLSSAISTRALGVSGDGSIVVGTANDENGNAYALRWAGTGAPTDLGSLGGGNAWAAAISTDGSTIVGDSYNSSYDDRAFRWTQSGGMVQLGDLAGGTAYNYATCVSADGKLIGGTSVGLDYRPTAVFWDESGEAEALQDYLVGRGLNLDGWHLTDITGVFSKDGLYGFVGNGEYGDAVLPFLVSGLSFTTAVPEPVDYAAIMALGVALWAGVRRKRKRQE